ncbi:GATA transcription factor 1 [Quercus robur]|uniref:GATA transcription factor 1 n=1 Tax=Quercus robur TaxID=38942 RepID=UPI002161C857|nr:GATA transcription factor 1 [Quercus robur]
MELDKAARFMEDLLLDFGSDIGEEDEEDDKRRKVLCQDDPTSSSFGVLCPEDPTRVSTELVEEELEWISNKDSFPAVESFILSEDPGTTLSKHNSPVSVLENSSISSHSNSNSNSNSTNSNSNGSSKNNNKTLMSCCGDSFKVPGRARSKLCRRLRRDNQLFWSQQAAAANKIAKAEKEVLTMRTTTTTTTTTTITTTTTTTIGRKCQHCGAEKTPQWRAGPLGPKTLCNACGVRYKSGRLVPEYRPASSPTFSPKMHSNSHRKIVEMRRQKGMGTGIGMVVKSVDKG